MVRWSLNHDILLPDSQMQHFYNRYSLRIGHTKTHSFFSNCPHQNRRFHRIRGTINQDVNLECPVYSFLNLLHSAFAAERIFFTSHNSLTLPPNAIGMQ